MRMKHLIKQDIKHNFLHQMHFTTSFSVLYIYEINATTKHVHGETFASTDHA